MGPKKNIRSILLIKNFDAYQVFHGIIGCFDIRFVPSTDFVFMIRFHFILILVLSAVFSGVMQTLQAQGPENWRERREGGPGGGSPPWMQEGRGPGMGPGGRERRQGGPEGGPPWMREGRDRNQGAGGNDAERNERLLGMLRSMDRNGDGKLEQNEIPEYRRNFVSSVVQRMGGDPNRTIDLNDLVRKAQNRSGSTSSATASSASRSSSTAQTGDPLVPYFGEKESKETPVLAFGQREPETKSTPASKTANAAPVSQSDQILRQAREIMNKYDKNKNGTLDKDKGEWVSSLPFNPDKADKNRDGRVSMSELIEVLGGKAGASSGAASVAPKQSSAYDRLPPGIPDWFFERDKDQDGQLTMLEYGNGKPWSEAIADEFRFLDKNNDGVVTIAEMFETLKQVDEEKRLKEEQAKREQERRKGVGSGGSIDRKPVENKDGKSGEPSSSERKPEDVSDGGPRPEGTPLKPSKEDGESTQNTPNWKPTEKQSEIPSNAPYSSGSSDSNRRERGGRSYNRQRTNSR